MNLVSALFLVILLASSSYAAGRLHGQLGYRLGFRSGYRRGFGDGDRAARLYRRREPSTRNGGPALTTATAVTPAMTAPPRVLTVANPPVGQDAAPAGRSRQPAGRSVPPGPEPLRVAVAARPYYDPPGGSPALRPTNRGVGMRGTMYHSTGTLALRGGRHAHPE